MARPWLFALVFGCAVACASPGREIAENDLERRQRVAREMAPFESAFDSVQAALDGGDDALARRILDRAMARGPRGSALERAQAFLRIIEGRTLVAALDLSLVAEPRRGGSEVRVFLIAAQSLDKELILHTGPGSLSLLLTGIDTFGGESRVASSSTIEELAELVLSPGAPRRIELGRYSMPDATGMAVRARWELSLLPGHIAQESESRPAQVVPIAPCEFVRLASWLPTAPVLPQEFRDHVGVGGFSGPSALERAVRIAGHRRSETLDLLAPVVAELSARVEVPRLAPSLRWLSGNRHLGNDGEGWKAWMRQWALQRQLPRQPTGVPADEPSAERLVLPSANR